MQSDGSLCRRKIYFDGYLPPNKWSVRQTRLLRQSENVRTLIFLDPYGVAKSPEDAFSVMRPGMKITPFTGRQPGDDLPKPPFLVPAVIEALRSYREWAPLVQVVPGEADTFCAQDVRRNGGIVLTSDSDLLIQDLGVDGRVSFFWEVARQDSPAAPGILASTYSFHGINDELGVKDVGGLPRVVFEQISGGGLGFDVAVKRAKEGAADTLASPEYLKFLKGHQVDDSIPADDATLAAISTLDPRVSEIVVQTLTMSEQGLVPDTPSIPAGLTRGPEALSMFLPVMMENRDLKSCWTASAGIRQMAYSVLQTLSPHGSDRIIEYRTLDRSSVHTGRRLDIPHEVEAMDECARLVAILNSLEKRLPTAATRWLAFAVLQDIETCADDPRSSLSVTLLSEANAPPSEQYSWDLIHYTAQIQATYYSLRIAAQVLDAVEALDRGALLAPFRALRAALASLPRIAYWPAVEDMPDRLAAFAAAGTLATVTDVLGIPEIDLAQVGALPASVKSKSKPRRGTRRSPHRGRGPRCPSLNPFALLSEASQD